MSVAMIGAEEYPVVFKIRTIDQDLRSQIYEISAKNETGYSRSDGHRNDPVDVQPSYGVTPISKDRLAQQSREVKEKFSDRDSSGNTLSREQQEYFKDSKARDEQGRLMVMYHGTPNGNHTTFRPGTYFTPDWQYADVYQNPGASMLSTKKNVDNPKTYEVYLDIRKPFDTRKPKERRIFMKEYYLSILRLTIFEENLPLSERIIAGDKYLKKGGNGDTKKYYENMLKEHTK